MNDPADPNGALGSRLPSRINPNCRSRACSQRPSQPGAGLALALAADAPTLIEAAVLRFSRGYRTCGGFRRQRIPRSGAAGPHRDLALHFENAAGRPTMLAWTEPALIAHNRQAAVLSGLVAGLLAAAMAFAAGAAVLTSRLFPRWAALFLFAVLIAELTVIARCSTGAASPRSAGPMRCSVGARCGGRNGRQAGGLRRALQSLSPQSRTVARLGASRPGRDRASRPMPGRPSRA